jgi:hypothetical protein
MKSLKLMANSPPRRARRVGDYSQPDHATKARKLASGQMNE